MARKKAQNDVSEIEALLRKRRRQCLVHRYLYYVLNESLVTDQQYDMWERELRELVTKHPEASKRDPLEPFCPANTVGSSNLDDYPRVIDQLAESLLGYNSVFVAHERVISSAESNFSNEPKERTNTDAEN